jgi:hypothetical protein
VTESAEFRAISNEMSSLWPSLTNESKYTPTNAHPSRCDVSLLIGTQPPSPSAIKTKKIRIATNLPPSPNSRQCECMMSSLECQAGNKLTAGAGWIAAHPMDATIRVPKEREIFESVCTQNTSYCSGVRTDTINGQYGTFSACNSTERVSWILNQYYKATGDPQNCNSLGGVLKPPQLGMLQPRDCSMMLRQAGPLGTGAIIQSPLPEDKERSVSHSLNTPQKSGIILGSLVFVFLIAGGLLLLQRRRKAISSIKVGTLDQTEEQEEKHEFRKAELPDTPIDIRRKEPAEVLGYERFESDGSPLIAEISGETGLFELPTQSNEYPELASKSSHSASQKTANEST